MHYVEMIKLQAASGQEDSVVDELSTLTREIKETHLHDGLEGVELYKNSSIAGYFVLLLVWKREKLASEGSRLGLQLAQALKPFGMTAHVVWHTPEDRLSS